MLPLAGRNPYRPYYKTAFARVCVRPPLPAAPSPSLAVRIPPEVGRNGLTPLIAAELRASPVGATFQVGTMDVAASRLIKQSAPRTFWSRPTAAWAVSNSREGFALHMCSTLWRFSRPRLPCGWQIQAIVPLALFRGRDTWHHKVSAAFV